MNVWSHVWSDLGSSFTKLTTVDIAAIAVCLVLLLVNAVSISRELRSRHQVTHLSMILTGVILLAISFAVYLSNPDHGNLLSLFIETGDTAAKTSLNLWDAAQSDFIKTHLQELDMPDLTSGHMFCNLLIALFCLLLGKLLTLLLFAIVSLLRQGKGMTWTLENVVQALFQVDASAWDQILMDLGGIALSATVLLNAGKWLYLYVLGFISWLIGTGLLGALIGFALVLVLMLGSIVYMALSHFPFIVVYSLFFIADFQSPLVFIVMYLTIDISLTLISSLIEPEDLDAVAGILAMKAAAFVIFLIVGIVVLIVKAIFGVTAGRILAGAAVLLLLSPFVLALFSGSSKAKPKR